MTTPLRIAILDDYQNAALGLADWQSLPHGTVVQVFAEPARDEADLVARLQTFNVVVAMRERTAFPASVVEKLPKLKLLASTGLRNAAIDLDACKHRGITVTGARGARMEVIAWSPNLTAERAQQAGARQVDKADLFAGADVVSLHMVLSPATTGIVARAEFAGMKPTAFLVNTARAGLVDVAALIDTLRARQISGAGLDVFWQEPLPPQHALCRLDNVVLTPHLGYVTQDNLAAFYGGVLDNIKAWHGGAAPLLLV